MTSRSDRHQPHPVTRSEFARRSGRKPSSITEACQGPLAAAALPGGRIDAAHPAAVAWAVKRGIDPAALLDAGASLAPPVAPAPALPAIAASKSSKRGRGRPKAGAEPAPAAEGALVEFAMPADVTDLLSVSLRELTTQHGSAQGFSDWLATRKQVAETARIESRNARDAGRLVSRELVSVHVIGLIEAQSVRLLRDASASIAIAVLAAARRGEPLEAIRDIVRSGISAQLTLTKRQISNGLRRAKTGDNPPEVSSNDAKSANSR